MLLPQTKDVRGLTSFLSHTTQDTISHVTSAALFSSTPTCPDVNMVYIAPARGPWICFWTAWEHKRIYTERLRNGQPARKTSFVEVQGANHLVRILSVPLDTGKRVDLLVCRFIGLCRSYSSIVYWLGFTVERKTSLDGLRKENQKDKNLGHIYKTASSNRISMIGFKLSVGTGAFERSE